MPSVLDATVVIQMVHFLCAYWILSKFFLKPAYALVMKIDAERAALKNAAVQEQEDLVLQRQQKTAELTAFQQELKELSSAPHGSTTLTTSGFGQPAHPECSQQGNVSREQKTALIKQLAAQLKKRVIHE
jgi:heme A synthase